MTVFIAFLHVSEYWAQHIKLWLCWLLLALVTTLTCILRTCSFSKYYKHSDVVLLGEIIFIIFKRMQWRSEVDGMRGAPRGPRLESILAANKQETVKNCDKKRFMTKTRVKNEKVPSQGTMLGFAWFFAFCVAAPLKAG